MNDELTENVDKAKPKTHKKKEKKNTTIKKRGNEVIGLRIIP